MHSLLPIPQPSSKNQVLVATLWAQELPPCQEVFQVAELSPRCPRMHAGRICAWPLWQQLAWVRSRVSWSLGC